MHLECRSRETAKQSNNEAQGRAAHPGGGNAKDNPNPNGVLHRVALVPDVPFIDFESVFRAQTSEFILERFATVMLFLIPDVVLQGINV